MLHKITSQKITCLTLVLFVSLVFVGIPFAESQNGVLQWESLAPMPTSRGWHGVAEVNGKIYAMGGVSSPDSSQQFKPATDVVEEYDIATDSWTTKPPMPTARLGMGVAVVNGKIYTVGGRRHASPWNCGVVEEYDPATDTWTTLPRWFTSILVFQLQLLYLMREAVSSSNHSQCSYF